MRSAIKSEHEFHDRRPPAPQSNLQEAPRALSGGGEGSETRLDVGGPVSLAEESLEPPWCVQRGGRVGMTSWRQSVSVFMASKRSTIYFDPDVHRALRMKAAAMDASISDVVNQAVRRSLSEDATDLEAFETRAREESLDFETVVRDLRRRGRI